MNVRGAPPQEFDASNELMQLVFLGSGHGIESVRASGGPLIPFLLAGSDGGNTLHRFVAGTLEESLGHARRFAYDLGPDALRYAIAYDGYVTLAGQRTDAIMVDAAERGSLRSYIFAQRYRPRSFMQEFEKIGNPAFVDRGRSMFHF